MHEELREDRTHKPSRPEREEKTLAQRIGCEPRTIQRRITSLVKSGLLEREERRAPHGGNKTNIYRLTPLIEKLRPFAVELLQEQEARRRSKSERQRRKRPIARIVRSNDS